MNIGVIVLVKQMDGKLLFIVRQLNKQEIQEYQMQGYYRQFVNKNGIPVLD